MSENQANDPGCIWREQPEEKLPVHLEHIVNRRVEELSSSTRSETLVSIGAALFLVAVLAWRLAPARQGLLELAFAAVLAWVAISLYWFRRRIWRPGPGRPDAAAATCLEYFRGELERRRDHLRNAWLWHGPLFLASLILIAVLAGKVYIAFQPLRNILPLLLLLALWAAFGFWRRRLQARDIQREIDEIAPLGTSRHV